MSEQLFLEALAQRFEKIQIETNQVSWSIIESALIKQPDILSILQRMEETGGEPAVVSVAKDGLSVLFFDCADETPQGRRSLCYDEVALNARKKHKPVSSAEQVAKDMGVTLLDEADYHFLQTLGEFDKKTSSWLLTPQEVRTHGGALFGDRRYHRVFIYHNGADSYYAGRGFRGKVILPLA